MLVTDKPIATPDEHLAALIEQAAGTNASDLRDAWLSEGLVNFGADFVTAVAGALRGDREKYAPTYDDMLALCKRWLSGKSISERADEDARRGR